MKRCVIIGNTEIKNYNRLKDKISQDDYIVFCDGGLKHKDKLKLEPDFIIGDFDSFAEPENFKNILKLPCEKDDTDTFAAVKLLIEKGFKNFLMLGVCGERLDHTLGNISILLYLREHNCNGIILDDYSKISLLDKHTKIIKNSCSYFSIISLSDELEGLSISGAKYPLDNIVLKSSYQFAVSNEPINDTVITYEKGNAILIEIF